MIITTSNRFRRGTPVADVEKMLSVTGHKFLPYDKKIPAEAYLAFDKYTDEAKGFRGRKVLYLGGFNIKKHGKPNASNWKAIDQVVYNSEFYKNICQPVVPVKKQIVINTVGSLPCDESMVPIGGPRKITYPLHFVCIAKWWKRDFKRRKQAINFFNDYILKKYPDSYLHVLGNLEGDKTRGRVIYYKKGFHDPRYIEIFRKCHIQLIFTPFDTGPKTIAESLHYRVPFICSNNCSGREYIDYLGKCGIVVDTDPQIKTLKDCNKYKPMISKKFYNKSCNYDIILDRVSEIIDNFEEYTSWKWNNNFNYHTQANKWEAVLKGLI